MLKNTAMKMTHKAGHWLAISTGGLLLAIGACTTTPDTAPDSTAAPSAAEAPVNADEPAAGDEATGVQTYDGPAQGVPVTAQYPDTMMVESQGSGEGVGVFFTFNPQDNALDEAEVSVFLPSNTSDTGDLMDFITGPNGLIESNGWYLDGSRADTASEFPYPWFEMVFDISTDFEQSGHILIGESNGQAIQVIVLYPAEMADQFWPAVNTVLDSLEFEPSLLPIDNSEADLPGEEPAPVCEPVTDPC